MMSVRFMRGAVSPQTGPATRIASYGVGVRQGIGSQRRRSLQIPDGHTPSRGVSDRCQIRAMTHGDINNGRLVCVIGIEPVRSAEFVIFRQHV